MQGPLWTRSVPPSEAGSPVSTGSLRDRLAVVVALVTFVCVGLAFLLARDTRFLMPGPLASVHSAIGNCNACHTKSGSGKLSWMHGLVAGDPLADSEACLTCHRMPDTAFHAHGASDGTLAQSTKRLEKVGARTRAPGSVRAQSIAFPTDDKVARGLYCATCHQEHQGVNFNLAKISSEQCHSCHVVKFDSFDGRHPQFENYPFKRRTRIIYDHAGHFGKHFPEVARKGLARRVPATCSSCHDSRKDKRIMAVAPFEQTCTACHIDQITGKERVSGPKGIAFLSLPGLDLATLKEKNAAIGEWPAASEAELSPFMKVMIARTERGRALIKTVDSLNLQDLSGASDDQIAAVTNLVWEVKRLFYALIAGRASDVLADLNISCGARLSANLVADLTASLPRDVVISAYQQWLPNLGTEMANRRDTNDQDQSCLITTMGGWVTTLREPRLAAAGEAAGAAKPSRLPQAAQQTQTKNAPDGVAAKVAAALPERAAETITANAKTDGGTKTVAADERPQSRAADQTDDLLNPTQEELGGIAAPIKDAEKAVQPDAKKAQPEAAAPKTPTENAKPDRGATRIAADERPQSRAADQTDDLLNPTQEELGGIAATIESAQKAIQPEGKKPQPETAAPRIPTANVRPDSGATRVAADERPQSKAADQTDDLLNPSQDELRGITAPVENTEKATKPEAAAGKPDPEGTKPERAASVDAASKADANASVDIPATRTAPVISIESDVDPESWAEYGGWYRQDYAIYYRPTGHKDKFIYSWLFLTGPQAPKGDKSPAGAVFDSLASNVAQGSCTKCHSVDDIRGGRSVNFSPVSLASKQGRFTSFVHEPHFGILKNRGCLTCHNLEKNSPYLQSYKGGNPRNFASNFGAVDKELCQTCHTRRIARQDCLLCHKYHVNGVVTPMMNTRIPIE
jgi:hypothetical protein